jgi:hypothetical protein
MAGYSGTPLAKKLGIKEGDAVAVLSAPEGFDALLAETLPGAVAVRTRARKGADSDVIVAFHTVRADL